MNGSKYLHHTLYSEAAIVGGSYEAMWGMGPGGAA